MSIEKEAIVNALKLLKKHAWNLKFVSNEASNDIYKAIELFESALADRSEPEPGEFTKKFREQINNFDELIHEWPVRGIDAIMLSFSKEACDQIDRLETENKGLKVKSRRYGKCPNNHITVYDINDKPHCMVADCAGPVHEVVMEIEYAQLQAELKGKKEEIEELRNLLPNDVLVNYDRRRIREIHKSRLKILEGDK